MSVEVIMVDYNNQVQSSDLVNLLNEYAIDPMGGSEPLSAYVFDNLAEELNKIPNAFSLVCYVDGEPAGFANCFTAFSTFKCKPLINIHDFAVKSAFRGKNISQQLLSKIEDIGRERGCCKITLEVLKGNLPAQKAYLKYGFEAYQLNSQLGDAQFWQKEIAALAN